MVRVRLRRRALRRRRRSRPRRVQSFQGGLVSCKSGCFEYCFQYMCVQNKAERTEIIVCNISNRTMFDANRSLIFIHIPKTGGTSVEHVMKLQNTDVFYLSSCNRQNTSCSFVHRNNHCNSHTSGPSIAYTVHATEEEQMQFVKCRATVQTFTVLRNPIERALSAIWYLKKRNVFPMSETTGQAVRRFLYSKSGHPYHETFRRPQVDYISRRTVLFHFNNMSAVWTFLNKSPTSRTPRKNDLNRPHVYLDTSTILNITHYYARDMNLLAQTFPNYVRSLSS